jgi:hypothetical protein
MAVVWTDPVTNKISCFPFEEFMKMKHFVEHTRLWQAIYRGNQLRKIGFLVHTNNLL